MESFKASDFEFSEVVNIQNKNGVLLASSRDIAEDFGKEHKEVINAIEGRVDPDGTIKNKGLIQNLFDGGISHLEDFFIKGFYFSRGKKYTEYLLTRDGFTLLVMGFNNTEKTLKWKLKYIEAFNKMEKALKNVYHISETALVNNFMNSVEDKLFKSIDERFEKYEENYRPTHKNKMDLCNYIKNGLGEDREDEEVDLVKQRVLLMLNGEAWQDIPYKTLISNMRLIDESIRTVKSFRTKKQVSLFDEIE